MAERQITVRENMLKRHNLLKLNEEGRLFAYREASERNKDAPGELLYEMIVSEKTPAIVKRQSERRDGFIEVGFSSWQVIGGRRVRAESLVPVSCVEEVISPFDLTDGAVFRIANEAGVRAGLFGSAAMAAVTNRPYMNEDSDLDILIEAKTYESILNFYERITSELTNVKLDIELDIGHGYAVKLAEFFRDQKTVMVKGIYDVKLFEMADVKGRFCRPLSDIAAKNAVKALLYEVAVTPKPGLVDMNNNGSHNDMDIFKFINSATALYPYFKKIFDAGASGRHFKDMRYLGMLAEEDMLAATGGANTHKGAIFSLGIICAAIGRLYASGESYNTGKIFETCALMTESVLMRELEDTVPATFGEKLYTEHGIKGVRGEAASGFSTVKNYGLPVLKAEIEKGKSLNDAAVITLLHLIPAADDTNIIKRGGLEMQKEIRERIEKLVKRDEISFNELRSLDDYFIQKNLSPGGSADLLAVTLMLYFMEREYLSNNS